MAPNHEKKGEYSVNPCLSQLKAELRFKNWQKEEFFLQNQSIRSIYPKNEYVIMVPNHEKRRDYHVNQCLSQLKDEHRF